MMLLAAYLSLFACCTLSYFVVIPVAINMIVCATSLVIIGSSRSLQLIVTDIPSSPTTAGGDGSEAPATSSSPHKEVLTASDAYKFPFIGSAALFSLYLAFKYLDKEMVNLLLGFYFSLIAIFTLTSTFSPLVSKVLTSRKTYGFCPVSFPWIGEISLLVTVAEIVTFIAATVLSIVYFQTRHYVLNNLIGVCFCIQGLERISIGSFKVGAILLAGLFVYDIFWVFGTEVMVTVAKSFDGPIKLLFPTALPTAADKGKFMLLGLGDIVVPGLFVSLMLRFDATRSLLDRIKSLSDPRPYSKAYFHVNVACYALGLVVTYLSAVYVTAQPALLYLVPAALGGSTVLALCRGELKQLFAYDEEDKVKNEPKIESGVGNDHSSAASGGSTCVDEKEKSE